jgi:hypothetical protein
VLELVVAPVLLAASDVQDLHQSALFEPFHAAGNKYGIRGMSVQQSYTELSRLDQLRAWGLVGLIVCNGALRCGQARLGAAAARVARPGCSAGLGLLGLPWGGKGRLESCRELRQGATAAPGSGLQRAEWRRCLVAGCRELAVLFEAPAVERC